MAFEDILVTAPGFRCDGGWVLDTQFIPYRALYSRNVPNMFMAGLRSIPRRKLTELVANV